MLDGPNDPEETQVPPNERIRCTWCNETFARRQSGGSPQRFCKAKCRRAFHTAARIWAEREIAEGRLGVDELRLVLKVVAPPEITNRYLSGSGGSASAVYPVVVQGAGSPIGSLKYR